MQKRFMTKYNKDEFTSLVIGARTEQHLLSNIGAADLVLTPEQIERLEAEGKIVVLRPSRSMKISRLEHDPKKLRALYELGV